MTVSHKLRARNRPGFVALCCSLLSLSMGASSGRAQVSLQILDAVVSPGSAAVEVVFHVDAPLSQQLAAYNVGLDLLPPGSGVLMVDAIEPIDHPPIFPGQSPLVPFTGESLRAADDLAVGGATILDGAGVIRVLLSIHPSAVGREITIAFDPATTFLFDVNAEPIAINNLIDGRITVVPEAGALTLTALSLAGVAAAIGWRRERERRPLIS